MGKPKKDSVPPTDFFNKGIIRIKEYVTSRGESLTLYELESRLALLESYFSRIIDLELEHESQATDVNADAVRFEVEDIYLETKSKISSSIAKVKQLTSTSHSQSTLNTTLNSSSSRSVRLQKLKLPTFSGKYTEWSSFFSTFCTLVDEDSELSDIEKFTHLRSSLSEKPLRTIQALEITAENYKKALKILKLRYDNKYIIFQTHIKELFDVPRSGRCSSAHLRNIVDSVNSHLIALRSLGTEQNILNSIVVHVVLSKLDNETLLKWDDENSHKDFPSWDKLSEFLNNRCISLEHRSSSSSTSSSSGRSSSNQYQSKSNKFRPNATEHSMSLLVSESSACICCKGGCSSVAKCKRFVAMTPEERYFETKRLHLCLICFQRGHSVTKCRASKCNFCNGLHNGLLHRTTSTSQDGSTSENGSFAQTTAHPTSSPIDNVILGTCVVNIRSSRGSFITCRALLDSGSQLNFMTERLASQLNLRLSKRNCCVGGIGEALVDIRGSTSTSVQSRLNSFKINLECMVLKRITTLQPISRIDISGWEIPKNIILADPYFHSPQHIDILIGAGAFFNILSVGQIRLGNNLPTIQKTMFGWIVSGQYDHAPTARSATLFSTNSVVENTADRNMVDLVQRFWAIETLDDSKPHFTAEELSCESHFLKTVRRNMDGRFIVRLPFKEDISTLGDSFAIAQKRFLNLERRLLRDPSLRDSYTEFIHEYVALGHMEPIDFPETGSHGYFISHHCVLKPESTSTKLRVVFDASCKTTSGKSLNDILMVGPTVCSELFDIVLKFRCHKYAITADISKMYRQVLLDDRDCNLQLILWRNNANEHLQAYRLRTVTYGTASAPYLATRCLTYLAEESRVKFPIASRVVTEDFYVDDMITGGGTIEEAVRIRQQVTTLLDKAGFPLHKWCTNDDRILDGVPEMQRETHLPLDSSTTTKTLGITWWPKKDEFSFSYKTITNTKQITKRIVLSELARLFDPLGLINPIVLLGKIFMQQLWLLKIDWDESLPLHLHNNWQTFRDQLELINNLSFSRYVLNPNAEPQLIELHGFSDASLRAYGCCIYLRAINLDGTISTSLLCSKSRVAPVKTVSLPRLELCGALLLAEMIARLRRIIKLNISSFHCWTDAKIVLHWIASHSSSWVTFVANRVAKIQEVDNLRWHHVISDHNPADFSSRGALPETLLSSRLWINGPEFLRSSSEPWPVNDFPIESEDDLPERRKIGATLTTKLHVPNNWLLQMKFINDFKKFRRIFAFMLRFTQNCRKSSLERTSGSLSPVELDEAFVRILSIMQKEDFGVDYQQIMNGSLNQKSKLKCLNPFYDSSSKVHVIRVGGRLRNADLAYNVKFPILVSNTNALTFSILSFLHASNLHAGPQALLALSRQRMWVINGRKLVRKVVNQCMRCFHTKPHTMQQIMGTLPKHRVTQCRPFLNTGVDFCGPIMVHWKVRGKHPYKAYLAIYVCFVTKATHLEMVSDLTSDAFIASLRRVVARRGRIENLYCDNATNFVGANRELAELQRIFSDQQERLKMTTICAEEGITFHFIPPRSPHFGGLWEAAVKSAKYHLRRVVANAGLTYEELCTLTTQIEALLNSRPLTAMSADPSDLEVLTPGHFLIGEPLKSLAEPIIEESNLSKLSRWQRLMALRQHFWTRWSKEYLVNLQQRKKWTTSEANVEIGTLVLIKDDNLPPQKWAMARVLEIHPGSDGEVRVVTLKTTTGTTRRCIAKICPLPLSS